MTDYRRLKGICVVGAEVYEAMANGTLEKLGQTCKFFNESFNYQNIENNLAKKKYKTNIKDVSRVGVLAMLNAIAEELIKDAKSEQAFDLLKQLLAQIQCFGLTDIHSM